MTDILIPELSENVTSGTAVNILVKAGDHVTKGQTLLELETDKAVLEVPSPAEGVIAEVLIKKGAQVKVGQAAFRINAGAGAGAAAAPTPKTNASAATQKSAPAPVKNVPVSVEISSLVTTVQATATPQTETNADVPAAPSVRRFARELGIVIAQVPGAGPHGRISIDDVKAYAKKLITAPATRLNVPPAPPLPDFSKWGEISREAMSAVRKKTAAHMSLCWSTVPHVTHFAKADITELEQFRQKSSTEKLKLTITPFIIKVLASALKAFPKFNASIDTNTQEIIFKKYYNIGIAVDTEHGLLVPVIKDADKKSIIEIAQEMKTLADKARVRKLTPDDMQGGTFTITNLGGITGGLFTPIVNAPESAILGISRAELEPCYNSGSVCMPRLMLPLCLSYDHRLIDGADGARFVKWMTDAIQQPFLLQLN